MKHVEIIYSPSALKYLESLDSTLAKRLYTKIGHYTSEANPLTSAKPLTGKLQGLYRYRVGNYRVIFSYDKGGNIVVLTILIIDHRKDVYR
mgnify:CR=1 FL=1